MGSATLLGPFKVERERLVIELPQIEGGGVPIMNSSGTHPGQSGTAGMLFAVVWERTWLSWELMTSPFNESCFMPTFR